jgi:outer membrane protein OmpA-like peptidoglycan-associated protein
VSYLITKGVPIDRFEISYKGSSELIESIGVNETNAVNRRVKFSLKK